MKYYLGIDLGASSGRHIVGYYDENNKLILDEVYRFDNGFSSNDPSKLFWDINNIFTEVKIGIKKAILKYKKIESMSIDTWGVDYVLLDNDKEIMPVYGYRNNRTKSVIDKVHNIISFEELYNITGSQFQEFNTIYQLYWDKLNGRLEKANNFLYIPEYLMYKLTGVMKHESTIASTSNLLDKDSLEYSKYIINKLGLKEDLFNKLSKPGEIVGYFKKDIIEEVGGNILVKLCATHDTGSAVEGIVMDGKSIYLSSGTWSLLGVKVNNVITSKKAMECNYSNELGPNYIRFQKNIMGLWIIQCLSKEMNIDFSKMVEISMKSLYKEIYDVNDNCFLATSNMKEEIIKWFKSKGIEAPKLDCDIINCTYHSLAYSYKVAIDELEDITGDKYENLYIVGGGAKNSYLNELACLYTSKNIIAMPIEGAAIGNILIQMRNNYEK